MTKVLPKQYGQHFPLKPLKYLLKIFLSKYLLKFYFCICVKFRCSSQKWSRCLQRNLRKTLASGNNKQKSAGDSRQPEESLSLQHNSNTRNGKCKSFRALIENTTQTRGCYIGSRVIPGKVQACKPMHSSGHLTWISFYNSFLYFCLLHAFLPQFDTDCTYQYVKISHLLQLIFL